jgi:hypothetical protein
MTIRCLFPLAAALLLAACEHGTDFEGTIIAPVDVQQLFSAEAPGQLIVVATLADHAELRDDQSVFCAPATGERRISARAFSFGCAPDAMAHVAAFALPRTAGEVDCSGAGVVRGRPRFDAAAAVAGASADVPVSRGGGGGCEDGHFVFTMTLAPLD